MATIQVHPVKLEIDGGPQWGGFLPVERHTWNGWECPYFTFETAQQIAAATSDEELVITYDAERDAFVETLTSDPTARGMVYPGTLTNAGKLYPLGAGSWVWDEA